MARPVTAPAVAHVPSADEEDEEEEDDDEFEDEDDEEEDEDDAPVEPEVRTFTPVFDARGKAVWKCPDCDSEFMTQSLLQMHYRKHEQAGPGKAKSSQYGHLPLRPPKGAAASKVRPRTDPPHQGARNRSPYEGMLWETGAGRFGEARGDVDVPLQRRRRRWAPFRSAPQRWRLPAALERAVGCPQRPRRGPVVVVRQAWGRIGLGQPTGRCLETALGCVAAL